MALNIKDPDTHRFAKRLATLTGESMTKAVSKAVRERLDRIERERGTGRLERILKISREFSAALKGSRLPDHGEFLYDEKGLPK